MVEHVAEITSVRLELTLHVCQLYLTKEERNQAKLKARTLQPGHKNRA